MLSRVLASALVGSVAEFGGVLKMGIQLPNARPLAAALSRGCGVDWEEMVFTGELLFLNGYQEEAVGGESQVQGA